MEEEQAVVEETKTPHVRITKYPDHLGVKTEIDGFELPEVRDVSFHSHLPGEIPTVTVNLIAHRPFEIDVPANVVINIIAMEGCKLIDTTKYDTDGRHERTVIRARF